MDRDLKKQIRAARIEKPRPGPKPPDIKGNIVKLLLFYLWHALTNDKKR
jgi:hypothetical protein